MSLPIAEIDVPTGATTLQALLQAAGKTPKDKVVKLIIQAPSLNNGLVYFGDGDVQPFELAGGDPYFDPFAVLDFDKLDITQFSIKGTSGDKLAVWWKDDPRA